MTDDLPLSDNQLRLATSRSLPAGTQLDSDTAAARESYLALGAALESAATNLDEAALIEQLASGRPGTDAKRWSPPVSVGARNNHTVGRASSTHNWWPLILCGALAASALFAI